MNTTTNIIQHLSTVSEGDDDDSYNNLLHITKKRKLDVSESSNTIKKPDLLANLPDNITCRLISCLSLKDIRKAMSLSKTLNNNVKKVIDEHLLYTDQRFLKKYITKWQKRFHNEFDMNIIKHKLLQAFNNIDKWNRLLNNRATSGVIDLEFEKNTLMQWAITFNRVDVVKLLLKCSQSLAMKTFPGTFVPLSIDDTCLRLRQRILDKNLVVVNPLVLAAVTGRYEIVKLLLPTEMDMNNSAVVDRRELLMLAVSCCTYDIACYILMKWRESVILDSYFVLDAAAKRQDPLVYQYLIDVVGVDPTYKELYPVCVAAKKGWMDYFKASLNDTARYQNEITTKRLLFMAIQIRENEDIVKYILSQSKDIDSDDLLIENFFIHIILMKHYCKVMKLLLNDVSCNNLISRCIPLILSEFSKAEQTMMELLARDSRFVNKENDEKVFIAACDHKFYTIIELLITEKRVDPSVSNDKCFILACTTGNANLLKLLLADDRTDPSFDHYSMLFTTITDRHPEFLKLLIADPRVDPSIMRNRALKMAKRFSYTELIDILMADSRVVAKLNSKKTDTTGCNCKECTSRNINWENKKKTKKQTIP